MNGSVIWMVRRQDVSSLQAHHPGCRAGIRNGKASGLFVDHVASDHVSTDMVAPGSWADVPLRSGVADIYPRLRVPFQTTILSVVIAIAPASSALALRSSVGRRDRVCRLSCLLFASTQILRQHTP